MDSCKVVGTEESANLENETIIFTVKPGYMNEKEGEMLSKAEVITVLNR